VLSDKAARARENKPTRSEIALAVRQRMMKTVKIERNNVSTLMILPAPASFGDMVEMLLTRPRR
jgi:hypothetical protein